MVRGMRFLYKYYVSNKICVKWFLSRSLILFQYLLEVQKLLLSFSKSFSLFTESFFILKTYDKADELPDGKYTPSPMDICYNRKSPMHRRLCRKALFATFSQLFSPHVIKLREYLWRKFFPHHARP